MKAGLKLFLAPSGLLCVVFLIFILGAITHERDILRTCNELGHSSLAMWAAQIKCSQIIQTQEAE